MKRLRMDLMAPEELRSWFELRRMPFAPKGVDVELVETRAVGEWQRPAGGASRAILFLHGGGYVFGSPLLYRSMTFRLALDAPANIFSLRYRLAPESRCPAPIEDALLAYEMMLGEGWKPSEILFAGDSAGGGLALATMQEIAAKGGVEPAGAVLYSPWTDLTATAPSLRRNAQSDCMFRLEGIGAAGRRYAGALDLKDPRVSPLFGEFQGLPPLLVFASESEMLFDDSARLVERARAAGVDVRFEPRDGLAHVWPLFSSVMPEAREALALTAQFVRERTPDLR
jgi:acetyl esterase/lipase